jgi:hypothetical protein
MYRFFKDHSNVILSGFFKAANIHSPCFEADAYLSLATSSPWWLPNTNVTYGSKIIFLMSFSFPYHKFNSFSPIPVFRSFIMTSHFTAISQWDLYADSIQLQFQFCMKCKLQQHAEQNASSSKLK